MDTAMGSHFFPSSLTFTDFLKTSLSLSNPIHTKPPNMQQQKEVNMTQASSNRERLQDRKVIDLVSNKRRLAEVPYTATLAHAMNTLVANKVVALPVAAPPGHWIGAGGSMIMEIDKQTGVVRKHYIGMIAMLDILAHIAGDDQDQVNGDDRVESDFDKKMSVPVSSVIGHCLEGLSLWTLNPNTSILDCTEVFCKGIHRALVPLDSHMENISGVELIESASSYRMLTQMDLMRFFREHQSQLPEIVSRGIWEIGAVNENIYAVGSRTVVIDAIKCMKTALLNAVPIVVGSDLDNEHPKQLIDGKGKKLIGTFSSTDLRGCHFNALNTWLPLSVLEFTESVSSSSSYANTYTREMVTCYPTSTLSEAIDKAVTKHVHRVWVVDQQGFLLGLVSLTDMIRVLRDATLAETNSNTM